MAEPITRVGAEHLIGDGKADQFAMSEQTWQHESWKAYGRVGEYKAAVEWIGNGQSQIAVEPLEWNGKGWVPETNTDALKVASLMGDPATAMKQWGRDSAVGGEMMWCFVRGGWSAHSRDEVFVNNGRFYLDEYGQGVNAAVSRRSTRDVVKTMPQITDMYRYYLPSARFTGLADTPTSSFLADLTQLYLLREVLNGKLNARLWMNGIWTFSQAVSMPTQQGQGRQSSFLARFKALVTLNMKREGGAADALPIFLQVNSNEVGEVIKQFYPEVKIDEREAELRAEIRNTLRELFDLPKEAQTGLGDSNHWGSWSIMDVNNIYSQMPRARAFVSALSDTWYQDHLIEARVADPGSHRLGINIAALKGEASSDEARQAHDRGVVGPDAVLAASRMTEDAKPTDDEYIRMVGWKTNNVVFALHGYDIPEEEWQLAKEMAGKAGRPGNGGSEPDRAPGVGDPGSPNDPNSEVNQD
jgi:hypothetical protein